MTVIICLENFIEENQAILHELEENPSQSTMIATAVEPEAEASHLPSAKEVPSKQRNPVFSRAFRFNIKNFLPGRGTISLRRFSITEAALLLMLALCASRGLGVIRQVIFNALFGTGPEANAYYAAARLPEWLFDPIAGGALTHALIPIFFSSEQEYGQK